MYNRDFIKHPVWNKGTKGLSIAWNKGLPKEKQPCFGKKQTDEHKRKSVKTRRKNNPFVFINAGKRMGLSNIGRKKPQHEKDQISKTMTGRIRTLEHCKNISKSWTNRMTKAKSQKHYADVHGWLYKNYGKANYCKNRECHIFDFECTNKSTNYEWANKREKSYDKDKNNFYQLCTSCHQRYDRLQVHSKKI